MGKLRKAKSTFLSSPSIKVGRSPISKNSYWVQFHPIDFKLSSCHSTDITHDPLCHFLFFCVHLQGVSREVLPSVQWSESQPDGRLSITWNIKDAIGGAVPADKGMCRERGRQSGRQRINRCWVEMRTGLLWMSFVRGAVMLLLVFGVYLQNLLPNEI